MQSIRKHLTYANLMATLGVFLALGGSAVAFTLGKNSVKSKNIAKGAVKTSDIHKGAVTQAKLHFGAVPAGAIASGSIGASQLGSIVVRRGPSVSVADGVNRIASADCNGGEKMLGGGTESNVSNSPDVVMNAFQPEHADHTGVQNGQTAQGVSGDWVNGLGGDTSTVTIQSWVLCLQ